MTAGSPAGPRSELRAFVRSHHPDVGGDPETFRTGLAALRDGRRAGPTGPGRAALPDDDPRLDAPITVAPDAALRRLGRAGRRFLRRHPVHRRSSRVL